MNTGIQRSSSTPFGASTTTSPVGSRSIGQIFPLERGSFNGVQEDDG